MASSSHSASSEVGDRAKEQSGDHTIHPALMKLLQSQQVSRCFVSVILDLQAVESMPRALQQQYRGDQKAHTDFATNSYNARAAPFAPSSFTRSNNRGPPPPLQFTMQTYGLLTIPILARL